MSDSGLERWLRIIPLRVRSLVRRRHVERELDEELRYHVERQTSENIRLGMTPDEARRAALRAMGGIEYQKERVRDTRGTRWIEELAGDVRFAARSLTRGRGFASAVVLTLALGIGANTAMFTLLRGTLLRPLPNRDEGRLVYLRQSAPGAKAKNVLFSVPEIADYRAASTTLAAIADYSNAVPFILQDPDGQPARARVGVVSGNYFEVMGLDATRGRTLTPRDDGASATPAAVLSYQFWMQHFGGDPKVVGQPVRLNEKIATVVGVLEPVPAYPYPTDVFVNTVTSPHHLSATMVTNRSHRMSEVFARLAPGVPIDKARQEIARISSTMFRDHPEAYEIGAQYQIAMSTLRSAESARASLVVWLLMASAAFVLLIACANVSNLTLIRGVGREREMLVRAALGAGATRLRRLLIVENLMLALIGGALGVLVAVAGLRLLVGFAAQFSPRADEIHVDGIVLAVGLVTSVLAAMALSFIPSIGGARDLASSLAPAGGGRRLTLGRGRQRLQHWLVVTQIAVCMVLLAGAGLMVRTLAKLQAVDTGVHADHVITFGLPLDGDLTRQIMNQPANLAKYESIRDRVATLPGVDVAAIGTAAPLRPAMFSMDVKAEGHATPPNHPTPEPWVKSVEPGYFGAIGLPLLAGRGFLSTDRSGTPKVVVLSRSFATELFGSDDPIGQHVAFTGEMLKMSPFSGDWRTVVGVVGDTRDRGLENDLTPALYTPFAQELIPGATLVVRTAADPAALQSTILQAIRKAHPLQLIEDVATVDQIRDETVAPRRLNAMFIAAFGALAFVIAMVGIAGVLAFSVRSRIPEIGIRMSLGADAARVRRMVLGEGGLLLATGVVFGVAGALVATRVLRGMLFGITPHDPATLGGVAMLLAAVGLAACWLPAERAARVDPAVALRAD